MLSGQGRPQAQDPGHHAAARRRLSTDDERDRRTLFARVDDNPEHRIVQLTLDKDPADDARTRRCIEVYKRCAPAIRRRVDNARALLNTLFFNFRRYDLGQVGRYKVNKAWRRRRKLKIDCPSDETCAIA